MADRDEMNQKLCALFLEVESILISPRNNLSDNTP
jgi:hypothetical protein